jgi:Acetyltransferase (GNAT) domain
MTELVRRAYGPYVARIGREPAPMLADYESVVRNEQAWVAEGDGRIVGLLVLRFEHGFVLLDNVAVAPEVQGLGIGSAVLPVFPTCTSRPGTPPRRPPSTARSSVGRCTAAPTRPVSATAPDMSSDVGSPTQAATGSDGLRAYIYVADVEQTLTAVLASGGQIVSPPYPEGTLRVALFADPAGNVLGIWQETAASLD